MPMSAHERDYWRRREAFGRLMAENARILREYLAEVSDNEHPTLTQQPRSEKM